MRIWIDLILVRLCGVDQRFCLGSMDVGMWVSFLFSFHWLKMMTFSWFYFQTQHLSFTGRTFTCRTNQRVSIRPFTLLISSVFSLHVSSKTSSSVTGFSAFVSHPRLGVHSWGSRKCKESPSSQPFALSFLPIMKFLQRKSKEAYILEMKPVSWARFRLPDNYASVATAVYFIFAKMTRTFPCFTLSALKGNKRTREGDREWCEEWMMVNTETPSKWIGRHLSDLIEKIRRRFRLTCTGHCVPLPDKKTMVILHRNVDSNQQGWANCQFRLEGDKQLSFPSLHPDKEALLKMSICSPSLLLW